MQYSVLVRVAQHRIKRNVEKAAPLVLPRARARQVRLPPAGASAGKRRNM
jgi:hypothetical protein